MLFKKLNAAFPLITDQKTKWLASFLFGAFVIVFLSVFQPFGIAGISFYKPLFILGYGLITFSSVAFCFFVLPILFKDFFKADQWTVGKAIFFTLLITLMISTVNWYYTSVVGKEFFDVSHSYIKFIGITFSVGIFPIFVFILFTEKSLRHKHEEAAKKITSKLVSNEVNQAVVEKGITFETDNKTYAYNLDQFICVKSEGNYIEIYSISDDHKLKKDVVRLSLKLALQQIDDSYNVHQCHRSYIANFDKIIRVSGNARNYELHIDLIDFQIPVSRSFSKELISIYK
ncbi:LytTR family transcriptional regulator DNA-binding domain-containing protein [Flammeovirga yaeyamensis]|uniref:LytTR family transcriptional regulator DNA-binding domain-containing protein n=1 Tax=Flammeovirga yaeyamensis TaxID=367791 RepID=A0AAX1N1Y9_9BACT|nr:LytTR family DNA-binding domain-containing protein [Flammeovirga yaeyamensis]MBB3698118.1 hypothetical protein [Flammeovirga yaeyamensis]NMF34523.1 LytTR family transcriptional regulator [Flammeovirga yaeyamensis]QWG01500.1 LytTR family transcriptional regulator DNA-binding domain-containing protein [Flammeovirga yaeyamensis]